MIPFGRDEILSRFAGILAVLETLQKFHLLITCKKFHPARRVPSLVLVGSRFAETKFSHVIVSARLSGMKKLINTSV